MSLDKRYPAFIIILAVFLGFFLFTSDIFRKDRPSAQSRPAVFQAAGVNQTPSFKASQRGSSLPIFPIDLNKASVEELTLLPGIGEKTAQRIVDKRGELNGFSSVDDLMGVKWVGKAKLEKIRGLVTTGAYEKKKQGSSR